MTKVSTEPIAAKSLLAAENKLFSTWPKTAKGGIVADGVVDPATFLKQEKRIVFVLKEANDPDGGDWDLREFASRGARAATWNNLVRWTRILQAFPKKLPTSEIKTIGQSDRIETLKTIAMMNLKKVPGCATAIRQPILDSAREHSSKLHEQLSLYDPDIVVACGDPVFNSLKDFVCAEHTHYRSEKRPHNCHAFSWGKRAQVFDFWHPQTRRSAQFLADALYDVADATIS